MIKSVSFQNYKAFTDKKPLELRPITVLIGQNSNGKTSVCKLIDIISAALSGKSNGLIPLKNGDVVLGDTYESLFHNNMTIGLNIDITFESGLELDMTYAMMDGQLGITEYKIRKNGDDVYQKKFSSIEESSIADGMTIPSVFSELNIPETDYKFGVDYIGPIRTTGESKRTIYKADINLNKSIGYDGQNAYEMLLSSYLKDGKLLKSVSKWFEYNMNNQQLCIKDVGGTSGIYSLMVKRNEADVNIADVGEGIRQVLPIIVQSFIPNQNLTIIEQPSIHLNSAAHGPVAKRLAESAKSIGKKYLIETHSETFLLALKALIADPNQVLTRDDVAIYYVDHDGEKAKLVEITLGENLEYNNWPTGLFDDDYELMVKTNKFFI